MMAVSWHEPGWPGLECIPCARHRANDRLALHLGGELLPEAGEVRAVDCDDVEPGGVLRCETCGVVVHREPDEPGEPETVGDVLAAQAAELWSAELGDVLGWDATDAALADVARLTLRALVARRSRGAARLYVEVTRVADVLALAPDPTRRE